MDVMKDAASAQQSKSRGWRSCDGGEWVVVDVTYDLETGELVQEETPCFICHGSERVYLYEKGVHRIEGRNEQARP